MTNEEKIFDVLAQISRHLDRMEASQATMQSDIDSMKGSIGSMKGDIGSMKGDIDSMKGDIGSLKGDIGSMKGDIDSMKGDIGKLQTDVARIGVTQENLVLKRLDLLSEGHDTLLTTLAPNSRGDALESDVVVLKAAVKALSRDVAELKKAE